MKNTFQNIYVLSLCNVGKQNQYYIYLLIACRVQTHYSKCITQQKIPTEKTVDFAQFILSP